MKTAINLGFEAPDYGDISPSSSNDESGKQKTKTVYPEFSIRDKPELIKAMEAGKEFTATVRLRCCCKEVRAVDSMEGKSNYRGESGSSADLEVLAITPMDLSVAEESDAGESAAEALDEYMGKKKEKGED